MSQDRPVIELGSIIIQVVATDPGPCPVCGDAVGLGPVGFSMDNPVGPRCDGCLLKADKDLGMLLWMAHVSRELAGHAADDATPPGDVNQCLVVLMAFAKLFNQAAEWPHRQAAAVELVKEMRARLAKVPFEAEADTLRTEPS